MRAASIFSTDFATVLNGRGIAHRKLDRGQLAELACDVVSGQRLFVPSHEQACDLFNVPRPVLREHLKARREFAARHPEVVVENGNGNGGSVLLAALRESTERGDVARAVGELLLRLSPAARVETARAVGVDWIWDNWSRRSSKPSALPARNATKGVALRGDAFFLGSRCHVVRFASKISRSQVHITPRGLLAPLERCGR
jgi:hypothetical protein